ncbi:hypothetical protein GGTG_07693 [Gaeumannomyces tritici R3-111a-1]|uniref:ABC transporter domain-containing protein n=1 Tax=Gaeumannomyces tritici (strain R3-111a-1) TaxID=644352 RepID=J3P2E6_GAET3|nr:hypothetical protein GGTG_07693 [Gaeumannomyces tritici R3-111a-1]EJT73838.1 hypothetical protein GGTG_07693 [Gaeumannomyces tritici R3-111a-1]
MAFIRQTLTLFKKNLLIIFLRHPLATILRAFILPIIITTFLTFAQRLFVPPAKNGITSPRAIRGFADALDLGSRTGRSTVAFVDSGFRDGEISRVIANLTSQVESAGKTVKRLSNEDDLGTACRSNLYAVSSCYGAVVFRSSPSEGRGGFWNYTIRLDGSIGSGTRYDVDKDDNDAQVFILPFQRAVDAVITGLNASSNQGSLPSKVDEYFFTKLTNEERNEQIRINYQSAVTNFMGVAFIAGMVGIAYHLTGFMATEREIGMSTLIESMMASRHPWLSQAARLFSYHAAFSLIYAPGWIIGCIIIRAGVFPHTSALLFVFYHLTAGFALASNSILGAAFFKKAQLSGVSVTIVFCVLAIVAQAISYPSTGAVAVLSLFFAPCNYVYFISNTARWERERWPLDLLAVPPGSAWNMPAVWLWVFLGLQTVLYPILGAFIERYLYGTGAQGRNIVYDRDNANAPAVQLEGFTKIYAPGIIRRMFSFISKPKEPVRAVDGLTLSAGRGQILALLGANGSGKSTTLDSIAGIGKLTSGKITIDGTGGLGIAPQKNVLWDEVTVLEHVKIFNRLKSPNKVSSRQELTDLVFAVDLANKIRAHSSTLSGGQKRKLQLAMMLTGGSAVCCVDEVSSGLDPLSRRKIWDILLAERGKRTMILTTHFLDEADLLADHIAVLSKGTLRAEGSSVELKERLGGGYRIHFLKTSTLRDGPAVDGVVKKVAFDVVSYIAPSSALAANVIRTLEAHGIRDYRFSGPTIEDVFLQLAEEIKGEASAPGSKDQTSPDGVLAASPVEQTDEKGMELLSGQKVGIVKQAMVLFMKRCIIFKHNWFPSLAAFAIPVIAAGLVTLFIKGQKPLGCTPEAFAGRRRSNNFFDNIQNMHLLAGPRSKFSPQAVLSVFGPMVAGTSGTGNSTGLSGLVQNITFVDTLDEFNRQIVDLRKNITPAGLWLGDSGSAPTLAFNVFPEAVNSFFGQNLLNSITTNQTLAATYSPFDTPWSPDSGNSLQMLVYICLALAAYPGFFSLYPNLERRRQVRGLQYSNGVRQFPLWIAYVGFDFSIVLASSALAVILFVALSSVWFHLGYIFPILVLYGLSSILTAYLFSIFCKNQLSAYAFTAGFSVLGFLGYLIAYLSILTFAPVNKVDETLEIGHYIMSAIFPIGSVVKAFFVTLNLFSAACDDQRLTDNPAGMKYYGGPILYLVIQPILYFLLLLWVDSGTIKSTFQRIFSRRKAPASGTTTTEAPDEEVVAELARITSGAAGAKDAGRGKEPIDTGSDGLQVVHLTKTFGKNTAVDNVTFGIKRGEVFALLGPNGAGKSTTISMIRGDIQPDRAAGGDIFVEGVSVTRRLAAARANLGVCPQFDAVDAMTVLEHLRFYARVRGIPDVDHNVEAVIKAVGLENFRDRQALALSGGNKRKLSLGIALMGNPSVVLLDEPSSGLDAAAKRIMWRTLAATAPGRSILLTTHSMEEADALAGRAGILARRMLAMGSADDLRQRFGNLLHVHLVCKGAPHTTPEQVAHIRDWIARTLPGADIEAKSYHGQMRFSVPASQISGGEKAAAAAAAAAGKPPPAADGNGDMADVTDEIRSASEAAAGSQSAIGQLVVMLEEQKAALGIQHYSVSPTTLDQVFLTIVGRHNVREEGYDDGGDGHEKLGHAVGRNLREGATGVATGFKTHRP